MDRKWKYLSYRIQVGGIVMMIESTVLGVLLLCLAAKTGAYVWLTWGMILVHLGMMLFFFLVVAKPYKKVEKQIELFLAGYSMTGLMQSDCVMSPAVSRLIDTVYRLLKSDKMLNANKRQAQYLALQNQINPHFLYNTLESIRSEAMEAGIINVMNMTEALANFFRYTVSKVENMVTLEEELDNVNTYFYIQQYRFERIHLSIEYAEEDRDTLFRCLLPKLTLQPVVENCIIHGLERKMGEGTVRILLCCTEKRLLIQISDDGVGMEPEVYEKINRKLNQPAFESIQMSNDKGSIALVNVNNRIHLIFGEEYGMTLYSTPGIGTDMHIQLPKVTSKRQIKSGEELFCG
ncbi:MAG: histidine kinase [Eubacteriales bacterium]|nr:histidine kinase [Eubacteriales bacterium]